MEAFVNSRTVISLYLLTKSSFIAGNDRSNQACHHYAPDIQGTFKWIKQNWMLQKT